MIKKLFTIKDVEALECGPILDLKNEVVAERVYARVVAEQKLDTNVFKMFYLGDFDSETGIIHNCQCTLLETKLFNGGDDVQTAE